MGSRIAQVVGYWSKKESLPGVLIVAGFAALGAFACLLVALQVVRASWPELISQLAVAAALFILFPERFGTRPTMRLALSLLTAGCVLGLVWVALFSPSGEVNFIDTGSLPASAIVVSSVGTALIAPLFEEKIVRGLFLRALASKLGPMWSSVVVSIGFALAHWQSMLWAFVASLLLCAIFFKTKMSTLSCVVVHGVANAVIMTWHFTHGFDTVLR